MRITVITAVFALFSVSASVMPAQSPGQSRPAHFIHPGMLHSAADLDRIKNNVKDGVEPWAGAWKEFQNNRFLVKTFQPRPLETVGRGVGSTGMNNMANDGTAAYNNAIAWYVTGDEDYAKKTVQILNAWSYKCKTINGKDAVLCAGIYGYKFANAAEIIRYSYQDWPQEEIEQFKTMMKTVFYPVIKDFATFANGNWDACCLPTMMSIGIFCDDRVIFDRAVRYYMDGSGDGSLTNYVVNEAGQCQESGRDQGHAQLGIALLASACQTGYNQGIDMYGAADNRLLKGFEYAAKYNLGNEAPFVPYADRTGKYKASVISQMGRGRFPPVYEMVYNHYQNRMGVEAPFTAQAAARIRPEDGAIDHPGYGTLLFSLPPYKPSDQPPAAAPAIPGPLIAKGSHSAVALRWVGSLNATGYTVKRTTISGGPYTIIAKGVKSPAYVDKDVQAGKLYYYVVSATNAAGSGEETLESGASAGLPDPWAQKDVGSVKVSGITLFDGCTFTLEGAGTDVGGSEDQFQYAYIPMTGDGTITARFVPQVPSQFAKMGLMMRETLAADSPHASLLITPKTTKDVEQPAWSVRLTFRRSAAAETADADGGLGIEPPYMTWGRLMEPYWLRLARSGDTITASTSPDGRTWTDAGKATVSLKSNILIGLVACSRLTDVTTTAMFDNVTAPGWPAQLNPKTPLKP
ncbi:MAG: alginate lyase family protein [Thermoguttaceae bacterium]